MNQFKYNVDPSINKVFIYGFGFTGKWLTSNIDRKVDGFIDTDIKKKGEKFNGVEVFSYEDAKNFVDPKTEIIISTVDIFDVVPLIEKLDKQKVTPIGYFLDNTKANNNTTGEQDEYIEYSLRTVEYSHKNYRDKNKLFIRSLDLMITERCSLKCQDCSNLMQYYKSPKNMNFEDLKKEMKIVCEKFDFINEIRLIGGEPFMNKEIYKILEWLCEFKKFEKIVIYTNATIPLKEDYSDILQNNKIIFSITDYGSLSKNTKVVTDYLDKYKIPYRIHTPEYWTDSGRLVYENNNKTPAELKEFFSDCCAKNLYTVLGEKIYRCPFVANADNLKAIPNDKNNYVSIHDTKENIKNHLYNTEYLPGCNYCKGRSFESVEIKPAIQTKRIFDYKKLQD